MTTSPSTRRLSSLPVSKRFDVPVRWDAEMRPSALPDVPGVCFMSRGPVAWVTWEGAERPVPVAVKALVLA